MSSIFLRVVCGLHLTTVHWPCLKRQEENRCMKGLKKGQKMELDRVQVVISANMWVSILCLYEMFSIPDSILLWLRTGRCVTLSDYDLLYKKCCTSIILEKMREANISSKMSFWSDFRRRNRLMQDKKATVITVFQFVCFISVRICNVPLHPFNSMHTFLYVHVSYCTNREVKIYRHVQNIHIH